MIDGSPGRPRLDLRRASAGLIRNLWQRGAVRLAVSGRVTVEPGFRLGRGATVWSAHGLAIGRDVAIGRFSTVEVDGLIGDHTTLSAHVGVIGRHDHDLRDVGLPARRATWIGTRSGRADDRVVVGRDVFVGWGAIILSGVTIGDAAVVAAGSVVTRDVAAGTVVAGNPARPVGRRFSAEDLATHLVGLDRTRPARRSGTAGPGAQ